MLIYILNKLNQSFFEIKKKRGKHFMKINIAHLNELKLMLKIVYHWFIVLVVSRYTRTSNTKVLYIYKKKKKEHC